MEKNSSDYLSTLPPELLYAIVSPLDFTTIVNLRSVCRSLNSVANARYFRNVTILHTPRSIYGVQKVAESSIGSFIKLATFYSIFDPYPETIEREWAQCLSRAICAMPNLVEAAVKPGDWYRSTYDHTSQALMSKMLCTVQHAGRDALAFLEALGARGLVSGIKPITTLELSIVNIRPFQKLLRDQCQGAELASRFQAILALFRHLQVLKLEATLLPGSMNFDSFAMCEYTMFLQAATNLCSFELFTSNTSPGCVLIQSDKMFVDLFQQPAPPWPNLARLRLSRLDTFATGFAIIRCHAASLQILDISEVRILATESSSRVHGTWRRTLHWCAQTLHLEAISLGYLHRWGSGNDQYRLFDGRETLETANDYQAVQDYVLRGGGSLPLLDEGPAALRKPF